MGLNDGWLGERVSSDYTVVPDLGGSSSPADAINLDQSSTVTTRSVSPNYSPSSASGAQAQESSGMGKVLVALMAVAAVGVGAVFGWPAISSLLSPSEPPMELAITADPTQRFVISDGTIFLEGSVPNEAVSQRIQAAAQQAVGTERVTNNFEISDDAVFDPNLPVSLNVAETVLFDTGTAQVADEFAPLIDLAVELLDSQPNAELQVIGHTDNLGSAEENDQLSLDRATAVADAVIARGIADSRLSVQGKGESEPMETNETAEGRSANRRVEFLISGLLN